MRLRYIGTRTLTFTNPLVGEVRPGDEFEVPDERVDGFLARADVVKAPAREITTPPTTTRQTRVSTSSPSTEASVSSPGDDDDDNS